MPTSQRIDPGIADMGQEFSVSVAGDNVLPAERLSWGARGNIFPLASNTWTSQSIAQTNWRKE
jgi:hypothetical protein